MVDGCLEANRSTAHLLSQEAGNVVIQRKGRSHIMMLNYLHHDVNKGILVLLRRGPTPKSQPFPRRRASGSPPLPSQIASRHSKVLDE